MNSSPETILGGAAQDTFGFGGDRVVQLVKTIFGNPIKRIDLHPGGLLIVRKKDSVPVPWTDVVEFRESYRAQGKGPEGTGTYGVGKSEDLEALLYLKLKDGQVFENPSILRAPILGQAIRKVVAPLLLEQMQAALQRGETLTLNQWKITSTKLQPPAEGNATQHSPFTWDDIQGFKVQLGYVSFTLKNGEIRHYFLYWIANQAAFLDLLASKTQLQAPFSELDLYARSINTVKARGEIVSYTIMPK